MGSAHSASHPLLPVTLPLLGSSECGSRRKAGASHRGVPSCGRRHLTGVGKKCYPRWHSCRKMWQQSLPVVFLGSLAGDMISFLLLADLYFPSNGGFKFLGSKVSSGSCLGLSSIYLYWALSLCQPLCRAFWTCVFSFNPHSKVSK